MNQNKNVVYLYSEIMPYAISVMRALVKEFNVNVECIYWDVNKKTPFLPVNENGITFHQRTKFDEETIIEFIEKLHPQLIYISGRMDKLYLKAAKHFKNKFPIITGCDNQWKGNLKHIIASIFGKWLYKRYFDYIWISGKRQYEYAKRIGYTDSEIINNMYTGDADVFINSYSENINAKTKQFPHNIVFIGRFAPEKGINILVDAFNDAKKANSNNWQLILVGVGSFPIKKNENIKVFDFMNSKQIAEECKGWGVFCLPSIKEPWGVVVHECAMAGLPLICSDAVGASDAFLINGFNGYSFESGNTSELKNIIVKITEKTDNELVLMSERSHEISKIISPKMSAYNLFSVLK